MIREAMITEVQMQSILEENAKLRKENEGLLSEIASLKNTLYWLRKKVFGKMSEKHLPLDPNQLLLFDMEEMTPEEKDALAKDVKEAEETITKTVTAKAKPARKRLDTGNLPVEVVDIYPEGTTDENGSLLAGYVEIGAEETCRMERVPSRAYLVKTVRHKVMRKEDAETRFPEDRKILIPDLPLVPVPKCIAGASVLTDIIISKFMYHLPFYRVIQQYKESGVTISDSTMGGWYEAAVEKLKLLYDRLRRQILSSEYVQVDESVIPVLDNEKHRARKGYEWCVRDAITGDVMFWYDRGSRGSEVARSLLGDYRGTIQCDGYGAYDQFEKREGVTLCGCWAHARRKFTDALDEDKARATEGVCFIRKLYKVEKEADEAGLSPEGRRKKRMDEAYPVLQTFEKWLLDTWPKVPPQSRMGKAISYTYALLPRLSRYVNDGRVNIDNNLIENSIRVLALGRKNYLFCGNDASAYRAAIVYSLIGTCKAAGVDPRIWMEDVLTKIPYWQRDNRDLSDLLPRAWSMRKTTTRTE